MQDYRGRHLVSSRTSFRREGAFSPTILARRGRRSCLGRCLTLFYGGRTLWHIPAAVQAGAIAFAFAFTPALARSLVQGNDKYRQQGQRYPRRAHVYLPQCCRVHSRSRIVTCSCLRPTTGGLERSAAVLSIFGRLKPKLGAATCDHGHTLVQR